MAENLLNIGKIARDKSPVCQPDENNHLAKMWRIKSPSGVIYEFKNLINFFREHEELIDGTPKQAADGVRKIKASLKSKTKVYQWHGWTLAD